MEDGERRAQMQARTGRALADISLSA